MIQNNITRTEELQEIVKSVIALRKIVNYEARAELENINTALQKLITKEMMKKKIDMLINKQIYKKKVRLHNEIKTNTTD